MCSKVHQGLLEATRVGVQTCVRGDRSDPQAPVQQRLDLPCDARDERVELHRLLPQERRVVAANRGRHVVDQPVHPFELVQHERDRVADLEAIGVGLQHLEVAGRS